jgi:hypothetical protein
MRSLAAASVAAFVGLTTLPSSLAVTIYGQVPLAHATTAQSSGSLVTTTTTVCPSATDASTSPSCTVATVTQSAGAAAYTGAAAYNPTVLVPPAVPSGLAQIINYTFSAAPPPGASIQLNGSFFGLSIEMSVTNQACVYPFFTPKDYDETRKD